jgi:hypothetical protein
LNFQPMKANTIQHKYNTIEQATEEQVFNPFDPKHNDGDDDGDDDGDGGFDGAMEDLALLWLDDENSVASFSTTGTNSSKSKVQARLERYYEDQKSIPSKESYNAKLEAAHQRREKLLSSVTQDKAGFCYSVKMDKVAQKIQTAESKIVALSQKLSEKMNAATERRKKHVDGSIRGKAVSTNVKVEKAKGKQAEKDAKVSALQKTLEQKLLLALERKESIVAAKVAKAAGDVSVSSHRGKTALEKKDLLMLKIRKKSERRMDTASKRRKQLRALEKRKKEVMMMRREMTKSMTADEKIESMQKDLSKRMSSAQERKQMFIQAKRAKAAEYGSSISDRGEEMSKERESSEVQQKTKLEEKLEAAMQRKAELQAKSDKKKEIAEARRQRARELGRQRKLERANISNWEDESLSPSAGADGEIDELQDVDIDVDVDINGWQDKMEEDELGEMQGTGSTAGGSYEEKRLQAKQQLMNEIQLANEAKRDEFIRVTKEMKTSKKPRAVHQREPSMASSIQSFGSIDNNEQLSFDECDVSISGLSKVRFSYLLKKLKTTCSLGVVIFYVCILFEIV